MPKGINANSNPEDDPRPLPQGWDLGRDFDGKVYFINHIEKKTTWIDPRDSAARRPVSEGSSEELPAGWERMYDYQRGGFYYVDHVNKTTQESDPRAEWKAVQENMLKQYLATAEIDLRAKEELAEIKEQRLNLAQDEYLHLSRHLNVALSNSTTSLSSAGSCVNTKYDPDLLRADVIHAKSRVQRLKNELATIDSEMSYKQKGVETLARVNDKFVNSQCASGITLEEAQAIRLELYNIHQSLSTGEQEKVELMKSLACLKDDLTRLQPSESSLDVCSLDSRLSTASQTDLSGEMVPVGARLAEMARLRLRYDDARRQVQEIQQSLASLEEKMSPGQLESDKDRLLLIQEKEQLLRELRSITPRSRSHQEMNEVKKEIYKLEGDLNKAMELSNRCIAERLKLHEEKQLLLQQLMESMRTVSRLESQLKLLSASTLSMSSSSSLGSLSSSHASSKGSLSSLSFTDIYGLSSTTGTDLAMLDLHRRVDKILLGSQQPSSSSSQQADESIEQTSVTNSNNPSLSSNNTIIKPASVESFTLSPRSSLSSVSSPSLISPHEQQLRTQKHLDKQLAELNLNDRKLSMISEGNFQFCEKLLSSSTSAELTTISESASEAISAEDTISGGAANNGARMKVTRRLSSNDPRFSSDDSVAGDSGVFEAPTTTTASTAPTVNADPVGRGLSFMNLETAQVQIKLKYFTSDSILRVGIEKARNLSALLIPENRKICVKAVLLPCVSTNLSFCTRALSDLRKPCFGESFPLTVPIKKLTSKTLQITIWAISSDSKEECLGSAQVSLADFDPNKGTCLRWYNVLSFHFMQQPSDNLESLVPSAGSSKQGTLKEESSDDSTIISSQTSTLTRNVGPEAMLVHADHLQYYQEEEEETEEEDDGTDDIVILTPTELFSALSDKAISADKETNTECVLLQSSGKRCGSGFQTRFVSHDALVKRSQTFSPSAAPLDKNDYICRLNRSDSDSAMPLYKRLSFQRSMLERRSLRVPTSLSTLAGKSARHSSKSSHSRRKKSSCRNVLQTPLDLELDLAAQKTKLELLQEEIDRLKNIKKRMEEAKVNGDKELPAWLADQDNFQKLLSRVESDEQKSSEDRRLEKMIRKSGKDIYKLRKTRTPKGTLDVYSFKEKMAFFTSLKAAAIPLLPLPSEDNLQESMESTESQSALQTSLNGDNLSLKKNDEEHPSPETSKLKSDESLNKSSNANQPQQTKFTYEIDPVIGVIV